MTLASIARAAGLSRSALAGRFKAVLGMTPMGYLTIWRMLKARDLLEASPLPIDAIGAQVGYESQAAFTRAFRRHFGHGPGAARRRARQSA